MTILLVHNNDFIQSIIKKSSLNICHITVIDISISNTLEVRLTYQLTF